MGTCRDAEMPESQWYHTRRVWLHCLRDTMIIRCSISERAQKDPTWVQGVVSWDSNHFQAARPQWSKQQLQTAARPPLIPMRTKTKYHRNSAILLRLLTPRKLWRKLSGNFMGKQLAVIRKRVVGADERVRLSQPEGVIYSLKRLWESSRGPHSIAHLCFDSCVVESRRALEARLKLGVDFRSGFIICD